MVWSGWPHPAQKHPSEMVTPGGTLRDMNELVNLLIVELCSQETGKVPVASVLIHVSDFGGARYSSEREYSTRLVFTEQSER